MELTNTSVKGLCITNEGKAWHKSAKREIKATNSGKIRFNGKLYPLQKLIDFKPLCLIKKTKVKTAPTKKKNISIRELQKQGFKKTKIVSLYITNSGKGYNIATKKSLSIVSGKIIANGKAYNVSKLILETFCKIPVRSGQIIFKNGNDKDFYFENLDYKNTIKQPTPNESDLIQCVRLYFEVDKKTNKRSDLLRFYISEVIKYRSFATKYTGKDFALFLEYYKTENYLTDNRNQVFEKLGFSIANGNNAINKYLNLLINECLKDFEKGVLTQKEFLKPKPTKTQMLKQAQKTANEMGLTVKIPLRKPAIKKL
ncbi:hypothetical protein [Flavobacterium muglaense]|uniref:Uncharacterized protein n=1 Tax=Flavobacterium muglaense TaxID=2764716 RepID=A0A923N307_9FLAO|nr:hypothetical protein [Flavobacterium muglaense]MBC5839214.1 hypothetical protein [Flavobacterium muglaense]MBC5845689.1 hypothetical protein [Flavobacterium muglaense]